MQRIAVFGAAGSVGSKTCAAAHDAAMGVVAIDRDHGGCADMPGVERRTADVLGDDLAPVLDGCDLVVSTLGLPFTLRNAHRPPPLYSRGTEAILAGMRRRGLTRLVVISAAFVVPQRSLPLWFDMSVVPALHAILDEMRAMEAIVADSGLDWTIARPGWLLDAPGKGDLVAHDETLAEGAFRCREADLARFLIDTAAGEAWRRQRPALGAPDTGFNESPLALGEALAAMLPSPLGGQTGGKD